jgi:hypothetical protein
MTQREVLSELRRLIGNPDLTETSDRDLIPYVSSAADWFVSETKNLYRTDTTAIALVASQREYPLTSDIGWILSVSWNDLKLTPSSQLTWNRDGTTYRTSTAANPSEFAVYDRFLILQPPASASAVTTDGFLEVRSIVTAGPLAAGGIRGIADFDMRVVLHEAAYEYLALHPSPENDARAKFCLAQTARLLPAARERAERPVEDWGAQFVPQVRRQGGSR